MLTKKVGAFLKEIKIINLYSKYSYHFLTFLLEWFIL